jgi:TonB family protein
MSRLIHHPALFWFLLLSFTLHLFLLTFLPRPPGSREIYYLGEPVVNVELEGPVKTNEPAQPPPTKKIRLISERKTTNVPSAVRALEPAAGTSPLTTLAYHTPAATEKTSYGASEAKIRNQLLGELQTRLSRYLVYPPLARRRGWEGTVLLGLRVESDGHLDNIRVEHGSGYAVLDHSALNSLNRLGRIAEASEWLNGRVMDMQLPVIYRLIEN